MWEDKKGATEQLEILQEGIVEDEAKEGKDSAEHIYVVHQEAEETEDVSPTRISAGASIEMETDDDDEAEQVASLFKNLSARSRRKTMDIIAHSHPQFLTSTMIQSPYRKETLLTESVKEKLFVKSGADVSGIGQPSLLTADGQVTLSAGVSQVIIKSTIHGQKRLSRFSGITPIPQGQVDFKTWERAATRLSKSTGAEEMIHAMQNSLLQPALDLVQTQLDSGDPNKVINFLDKAYGTVFDQHSLLRDFYEAGQNVKDKETPSAFLNRLYLLVEDCQHAGAISRADGPISLIKQFNQGCVDETLITRLRLEEKESNPPDFATLLMMVRKEEAKRTKKMLLLKMAKAQQVQAAEPIVNAEMENLKRELASLKEQVRGRNREDEVSMAEEVRHLRQEVSNMCQSVPNQVDPPKKQAPNPKLPRRRFCFKCGEFGHMVWDCKNGANPLLVTKRFEESKLQRAENR